MDLSNLSPEQQQTFLSLLGQQNQQSIDPSTMNVQPQAGMQQPPQPPSIQQQDGDKMHPMDAIKQITQGMSSPQQQPSSQPAQPQQAAFQIIDKNGVKYLQQPNIAPLGRLLGKKTVTQPLQDQTNYYNVLKNLGHPELADGVSQIKDINGDPWITKGQFNEVLKGKGFLPSPNQTSYKTMDQLTSVGIPQDVAANMLAANPKGVLDKQVSAYQATKRLGILDTMAEARATLAGVAQLNQQLKVGGFDAAQTAAKTADKNLGTLQRAQAAIQQINDAGGMADQRQRTELSAALGQAVGNSQGVLTNEALNMYLPQSLKSKFGNVLEYWTNERQPVDFSGFLPQLQDLLTRETLANKGVSNGAAQLGLNIYGRSNPKTAAALSAIRQQNPLVGNPPPPAAPGGQWRVIR